MFRSIVQRNMNLELTVSFPLVPMPCALATADVIPVKTDKSKLLHHIEPSIEVTQNVPRMMYYIYLMGMLCYRV